MMEKKYQLVAWTKNVADRNFLPSQDPCRNSPF